MKLNRYQAFATHLMGSVAVALCSAALVFLVWYPDKLPQATGVTNIFLMLLAVDVVVGPIITLIVFAAFSALYLKEPLGWNHAVGFAFIAAGAFFIFHKW